MDALMRATLVAIYGETAVAKLEAARAEQAELQRIADDLEAARFAAEMERDAALGSGADWHDE